MRQKIIFTTIWWILVVTSSTSRAQIKGTISVSNFESEDLVSFEISEDNLLTFDNYPQKFVGSYQLKLLSSPLFKSLSKENCNKIINLLKNIYLSEDTKKSILKDLNEKTKIQIQIENYPLFIQEKILQILKVNELIPNSTNLRTIFFKHPFTTLNIQLETRKAEDVQLDETNPTGNSSLILERLLQKIDTEEFITIGNINGIQGCSLISGDNVLHAKFSFSKESRIIQQSLAVFPKSIIKE